MIRRRMNWPAIWRRVARLRARMVALGVMSRCDRCEGFFALGPKAADAALCRRCSGGDA